MLDVGLFGLVYVLVAGVLLIGVAPIEARVKVQLSLTVWCRLIMSVQLAVFYEVVVTTPDFLHAVQVYHLLGLPLHLAYVI